MFVKTKQRCASVKNLFYEIIIDTSNGVSTMIRMEVITIGAGGLGCWRG